MCSSYWPVTLTQSFAGSVDGIVHLAPFHDLVVPALVALISRGTGHGSGGAAQAVPTGVLLQRPSKGTVPQQGTAPPPPTPLTLALTACQAAAATLVGIATTDEGTLACLKHGVPQAMVDLAHRGVSGAHRQCAPLRVSSQRWRRDINMHGLVRCTPPTAPLQRACSKKGLLFVSEGLSLISDDVH
jgi:hypothetical protein